MDTYDFCFVLNHQLRKGLSLFREMLSLGVRLDAPVLVSVLLT